MRKNIRSIVSLLILIYLFTGCTQQKNSDTGYKIFEIGGGTLSSDAGINHQYETKNSIEVTTNNKATRFRTINIFGTEYELEYKETHYLNIGDYTRHRYIATNAENSNPSYVYSPYDKYDARPSVLFQEGTDIPIMFSGFHFARVEITDTMTEEDLFETVEQVMGTYVDFSQYNERSIQRDSSYCLYWKKKVGEYYLDNRVKINIHDDGGIWYFEIIAPPTPGEEEPSMSTVKELSTENIEALLDYRLHQIYDTETCKLMDYDIEWKRFTKYQGKDSIYYYIHVKMKIDGADETDWPYLLITLE